MRRSAQADLATGALALVLAGYAVGSTNLRVSFCGWMPSNIARLLAAALKHLHTDLSLELSARA